MVICNCKDGRPLCPVTPPLLIPTRRPIGASRIFQMINPVEKFYWAGNQEVADSLHCQTIRKRNFSSDLPFHQGHQQFSPEWDNLTKPCLLSWISQVAQPKSKDVARVWSFCTRSRSNCLGHWILRCAIRILRHTEFPHCTMWTLFSTMPLYLLWPCSYYNKKKGWIQGHI